MSSSGSNATELPTQGSNCASAVNVNDHLGLRISAILVILVTSLLATLFPILVRRSHSIKLPLEVYDFAKFFGSGVIIATAFIHLLASASEALSSPCLPHNWSLYPWAQAIAMCSVFMLFIVEIMAVRIGTAHLGRLGLKYRSHAGHEVHDAMHPELGHTGVVGPTPSRVPSLSETTQCPPPSSFKTTVDENLASSPSNSLTADSGAHLVGVATLEFGVVLHSVVLGLTLAVDSQFTTLYAVIIFHQMFEGLGIGSRLSQLKLGPRCTWVPVFACAIYALVTPLGLTLGLILHKTYDPTSPRALMVSGVLDSFSAGVLLYTGLVELLAHDFIFNHAMLIKSSNWKLFSSIGYVVCGAVIMALLGCWA